ncbi:hypothetical protein B0H13DRAFT_2315351 [Mycena leptocephala]|nr:hypothetical protein B0H13DRAFT_2315351 [Mycena leptocephala]
MAYEQSLDKTEQDDASEPQPDADVDMPGLQDISDGDPDDEDSPVEPPTIADPKEASPKPNDDEDGPKTH